MIPLFVRFMEGLPVETGIDRHFRVEPLWLVVMAPIRMDGYQIIFTADPNVHASLARSNALRCFQNWLEMSGCSSFRPWLLPRLEESLRQHEKELKDN